jgi:predicted short-subunit dehydrogenase-like oxidoreductase (DUF2520 family)
MLTVNIIGAGAVGQTLGYLLVKHAVAQIQAIVNHSPSNAQRAVEFMGQGKVCASILDLPSADLILVTVPDQQIEAVARTLVNSPNLQPGTMILHCSGALSSACMDVLHSRQCWLASLHPAFSFKQPHAAIQQFTHIPCALEGDEPALDKITALFTAIGAEVYRIAPEHKALYHTAAVFASNYPVALLQQAYDCFTAAGLSGTQAKAVVCGVANSMLQNVSAADMPKLALTGPLQRGDVVTIRRHLETLQDPKARDMYVVLAHKTLAILDMDDDKRQEIEAILLDF